MVVVVAGTFALGIAPERLFTGGSDAERFASLVVQERLLRAMIAAEVLCYVAFAGLAVSLHRLLAPAGAMFAAMMAVLVLVSVPFGFANATHLLEITRVLDAPAQSGAIQTVAEALARYRAGIFLQSVPWGLWLLPFGWLVIRCGFLPRLLGAGLILAGLGYVAHFMGGLLFEGYRASIWPDVFSMPRVSELLICGWLLVFGARRTVWPKANTPGV